MSADYVSPPGDTTPDTPEEPGGVRADFAAWGFVAEPTEDHPLPALVLGNGHSELYLELEPETLDWLLAELTAQIQYPEDDSDDYQDGYVRLPLSRRVGMRAAAASGWPAANSWWREAGSNTRIIVAGVIAAVMVLGLLVTF
ncbi:MULTISPECIES: hypothetical protein [Streptomyces]|uniref:hypothetical protein n=1 Tax=Streptomyces TaxID=1883 RepID=UPI002F9088D5